VPAVAHIAEHLLTPVSRLVWPQRARLAKGESAVSPETRVVGSYTRGLHAQGKAGESVVINLKGLDPSAGPTCSIGAFTPIKVRMFISSKSVQKAEQSPAPRL
jgi:hypothetical protein